MKKKLRQRNQIDNRGVAIYARKSRITHKGDSTGIQIKQSADFASSQLQLPPDYEFMIYEDKGLSGYYSDRPDFQKMLHDIEAGKIRAVVCYKLDRISRKTSDLLRLVDFLDKYDVALLVCSNNINTMISTSKIMISFLAIIAEFERDIIAERISDNLVELAKDGRWMGGCAPTGFSTYRVTMGTGKNKTSITYLQTEEDEKTMVLAIFKSIRKLRSLSGALKFISQTYKTKNGKDHTILSLKDIARNPNYCTADQDAYEYFYERNGNICKDQSEFDGTYGLAVYNRTEQEKLEDEDSTFIEPKFAQVHTDKPIDEWIVSIGKHEGFIPGKEWVEVQEILDAIEDKYNRPHRATNALLSGLLYCPICGHRLNVFPESNRWTNGQPRFKYGCPNQRYKKSCTFKPIDGNRMDSFVLEKMATVADEASGYYTQILDTKMESLIRSDSNERDLASAKTKMEKIQADIAAQVRNMREADENIRSFIQADISQLSEELSKTRDLIVRLEDAKSSESKSAKGLGEIKKIIFSFPAFIESSAYEEKLSLLNTVIERIIILDHGNEQICHIFVKGTPKDKYDDFFVGGYLSPEFLTDTRKPQMCNRDRDSKRHPLRRRHGAAAGLRPAYGPPGARGAHRPGQAHPRLSLPLPVRSAHRGAHHHRPRDRAGPGPAGQLLPGLPGPGGGARIGQRGLLLHLRRGVPLPQRPGRPDRRGHRLRLAAGPPPGPGGGVQRVQRRGPGPLRGPAPVRAVPAQFPLPSHGGRGFSMPKPNRTP